MQHPFQPIRVLLPSVLLLAGCVPASQTTAFLNEQTEVADSQHWVAMSDRKQLLQERRRLKHKLAVNQSRILELKVADPSSANSSTRVEIQKLERENITLNRYIANAM